MPLTAQVLEVLRQHKAEMEQLGIDDPYGLVFVTPTSHTNIYDHLVGRVWKRSLERCGLIWQRQQVIPPRCCLILMPNQQAD